MFNVFSLAAIKSPAILTSVCPIFFLKVENSCRSVPQVWVASKRPLCQINL